MYVCFGVLHNETEGGAHKPVGAVYDRAGFVVQSHVLEFQ
jgi:hypothetical protein